jgi:hypothetical protein
MRRFAMIFGVSVLMLALVAGAALAAWWVDADGFGFVGKGDVQLVYGWNNKQLQDNAGLVDFRISSVTETESEWSCSKQNPGQPDREIVQERSSTTVVTTQGLLTTVARDNSKGKDGPVTGFYLDGYEGSAGTTTSTKGPAPKSCPATASDFEYDKNLIENTRTTTGGLEVTINGTTWLTVPVNPPALP